MTKSRNYGATRNVFPVWRKICRGLRVYTVIYLILIVCFLGLLYVSALLPHSRKFVRNMRRSAALLEREGGLFPTAGNVMLDHFSDATILNIAFGFHSVSPLDFILCPWHVDKKGKDKVRDLNELVRGNTMNMKCLYYYRYWHGHSAIMKLCHYFWSLKKIYALIGAVTFFLAVLACILVYERFGKLPTFALFALLALCNFHVFFLSLQFYPVMWLGLGGLIWFCFKNDISGRRPAFFALGMLCAYFDFLTAPVLAFGIPALIVCGQDTVRAEETGKINWKSWGGIWCGYPAAYLAGYVLSWGAKIVMGGVASHDFGEVWYRILLRSGSSLTDGTPFSRWRALAANFDCLYSKSQICFYLVCFCFGVLLLANLIRLKQREARFDCFMFAGYLFLAVMPIAVILLLANHAMIHFWFTCRGLTLTVAACLMTLTAFHPKRKAAK